MNLNNFKSGDFVHVLFKDGVSISGLVDDFTSSWDNDDNGDYLTIVPESGKFKNLDIQANENEIQKIYKI